ncbi:hypothetical protein FJR37_01330 [Aphanizomenon sp. UHCC 0183]|nr:hypothetical protein [Aphanizomenon sp. UHCC 0183]
MFKKPWRLEVAATQTKPTFVGLNRLRLYSSISLTGDGDKYKTQFNITGILVFAINFLNNL